MKRRAYPRQYDTDRDAGVGEDSIGVVEPDGCEDEIVISLDDAEAQEPPRIVFASEQKYRPLSDFRTSFGWSFTIGGKW